jgi:glyoxylase-like metal-dependent hydrolase (beta-lactamase superfamily II)
MKIKTLILPPLDNNVYIVYDEEKKQACIIDVALGAEEIYKFVKNKGLNVRYIINTHAHIDHTAHNKKLKSLLSSSILAIHEKDKDLMKEFFNQKYPYIAEDLEYQEPDITLKGEETLDIGSFELKVIHTPGHTPGSICLYNDEEKVLFSGDTLFLGTYGRVDFPYSNEQDMLNSLRKLAKLPRETIVYPGHGSETRIGLEYWLFNL